MVFYPPLYSTLLAGIALFGIDPVHGARGLNAVLFAANIFLAGLCVHASTRSWSLSVGASLIILASFPMVLVHSMAWSEPLFIVFAMLGLHFLALHVERPKPSTLVGSSVAVGLALLTRYAGLALVATGVGGILTLTRQGWKRKWLDTIIFCSISGAPMLLWVMRNLLWAGVATGRKTAFHPLHRGHWEAFWGTVTSWLFPGGDLPLTNWSSVLIVALLSLIFLLAIRRERLGHPDEPQSGAFFPTLLGLFILSYGSLLMLSISFLDAQTPLDHRIFSPVYLAVVLLLLCGLRRLFGTFEGARVLAAIAGLALALLSVSQGLKSASWLRLSYSRGLGYASREWGQSKLLEYLRALKRQVPIFTNGPDVLYLLADRPGQMIPRRVDPGTASLNKSYADEMASVSRVLREKGGLLVYFHGVSWRWYLPSAKEAQEELGLRPLVETAEGVVYQPDLRAR